MNLHDEYKIMLQETRKISIPFYICRIEEPIKFISLDKFSKDDVVQDYLNQLMCRLKVKDFGLDSKKLNEFCQIMGECHFYCLCLERSIKLVRLIEDGKQKVPDFLLMKGAVRLYFEVKTPSIVGGDIALNDDVEDGFKLNAYLEKCKSDEYKSVFHEHSPYGKMVREFGHVWGPIKVLSKKIVQNFKPGQFSNNNTFMVVNLSLIHNLITPPEELRPVYALRDDPNNVVSGIFWMMAFRKIGMAVFGVPLKTHGYKFGIDGYCEDNGVLIDNEKIEGLLLITNPPQKKSEIWGLFRSRTLIHEHAISSLLELTDYRYNDELNSRGMTINEFHDDFIHNDPSK